MWNVGRINAVCAVLCEQHACGTPMPVPRTAPRLSHEQFWEYYSNSFCCCLVNLRQTDFLSKWTIRAACTSSSHVVHVAAPRVHDPLELCHVIGVKIWVNICPPSFLIVRPMRKLTRPVPSAVLSIRTFFVLIRPKLMKHLMPPYWSDMSDINFLWLHASQSDGSLFLTV